MSEDLVERIRRHRRPLEPVPTGLEPRLQPLPDVRAVLFDVYGTLVISASGDVGTADKTASRGEALREAFDAVGLAQPGDSERTLEALTETIYRHHERARRRGIDYPEVNIVDVWRETLATPVTANLPDRESDEALLRALAVEFECRANPAWPMPHAEATLAELRRRGITLGLVSNAQFFTPLVLQALFGRPVDELGFAADLQCYSYQHGRAKPGTYLYERAAAALAEAGIGPGAALYAGNDLLNDVLPAQRVGFRTALFAGDDCSLRLRAGDDRVKGVEPDLVFTDLRQLVDCLSSTAGRDSL